MNGSFTVGHLLFAIRSGRPLVAPNDSWLEHSVNSHLSYLIAICRSGRFSEENQQVPMSCGESTSLFYSDFVRTLLPFSTVTVTFS